MKIASKKRFTYTRDIKLYIIKVPLVLKAFTRKVFFLKHFRAPRRVPVDLSCSINKTCNANSCLYLLRQHDDNREKRMDNGLFVETDYCDLTSDYNLYLMRYCTQ